MTILVLKCMFVMMRNPMLWLLYQLGANFMVYLHKMYHKLAIIIVNVWFSCWQTFIFLFFWMRWHGWFKTTRKMLIQEIYSCGSGKLIQFSRIDAILSASEICQDEIRLHPELSDGTTFVRCHNNGVSRYHRKSNQSFHHDAHRPNETGNKYSADDCAFSETVNVLNSDRSKRMDFTTHSQSKLQPLLKGRNVYMLVSVQS